MSKRSVITVETVIDCPPDKTWNCWTEDRHIVNWNFASEDWHCPAAVNDLRPGGQFSYRMEAKDGAFGFDFAGVYTVVEYLKQIEFQIEDGRHVSVEFQPVGDKTNVVESFEAEDINSHELQRAGWQAILDNFRRYAESLS